MCYYLVMLMEDVYLGCLIECQGCGKVVLIVWLIVVWGLEVVVVVLVVVNDLVVCYVVFDVFSEQDLFIQGVVLWEMKLVFGGFGFVIGFVCDWVQCYGVWGESVQVGMLLVGLVVVFLGFCLVMINSQVVVYC